MIVSTVFRIQTFVICYVIIRQVWQLIARRLVIIIISRRFSSPLVSKVIIGTILCLVVRTIGRNRYMTCQFIWLVRLLEDNVIFVGMILYVWVFCRPNSKGGSSSCCVLFMYIFRFPKKNTVNMDVHNARTMMTCMVYIKRKYITWYTTGLHRATWTSAIRRLQQELL